MGEASKARNMFEHCLDTGVEAFIEYRGAKIELAREKGGQQFFGSKGIKRKGEKKKMGGKWEKKKSVFER